jgi:hypothetical protein
MGGALGLAVLSGVAPSVTSHTRGSVAHALVTGYDAGMVVAAALTLIALVVAITVIRRPLLRVIEDVEVAEESSERAHAELERR